MSDVYNAPEPVDFMQRRAAALAMRGTQANPDDATRALQLSRATGVPPAVVSSNLENFDADTRNRMTAQIVKQNPQISDYVLSHPLAAEISNDDYANLDSISGKLKKHAEPTLLQDIGDVYKGLWHSITTVPGESETTVEALKGAQEFMQKQGLGQEAIEARLSTIRASGARGEALQNLLFSIPMAVAAPGIGAFRHYIARPIEKNTGFPIEVTEGLTMAGLAALGTGAGLKYAKAADKVEPYLAEGKEPPLGIHPELDKEKIEQSKVDLKNLDEMLKDAQKSTTRERDPRMFAKFIEQHTDAKIYLDAAAVRKMYGNKLPTADDGKLGFVPRLEDQLRLSEMGGGDIAVPLSDWLANVDPKVAKELADDIRVRAGGITVNEAKVLNEQEAAKPKPAEQVTFKTALGSEYKVEASGNTTRNKSFHPEHGEKDQGPQPTSEKTFYITKKDSLALAEFQAQGAGKKSIEQAGENQFAMKYLEGPNAGKFEKRTLVTAKTEPGVGLIPVELFDGGKRVHFGNKIIEVGKQEFEPRTSGDPAVDAVRQTARLDPILPEDRVQFSSQDLNFKGDKAITVKDSTGKEILTAEVHLDNGVLKILDIYTPETTPGEAQGANKVGPGKLHSILQQMQQEFPEVQKIEGNRVTGARAKAKGVTELSPSEGQQRQVELPPVAEGAIKRRSLPASDSEKPSVKQLELPDVTRMEDRAVFEKAAAIGMTADQYKRYTKLIDKRAEEDAAKQLKTQVAEQERRQGAEWKANKAKVIEEVRADFTERPDISADTFFRQGELYGQKLGQRPKIDPEFVDPEIRKALPKEYFSEDGLHPDDAANLFGYASGEEMLTKLAGLMKVREESGLGPKPFLEKLMDAEADRRMEQRYGSLEKSILDEAKEHVLGETQLDLLHEETLALASKAGQELPIQKAGLKQAVIREFNRTPIDDLSSDKFLADAGKAGRAAELALLKGDFAEAFRNKQAQFFSVVKAQEAKKLEKEIARFDRQAKMFSARDLSGKMPQEYGNFIHQILGQVGKPVKRTVADLAAEIANGEYKNLEDFVAGKSADLREIPVADFLFDETFKTELGSLSAEDFRAVRDSVATLAKNGRDERKILRGGEEADLAEVKTKMLDQLGTFAQLHYNAEGKRWLGPIPPNVASAIRTYGVSHLQIESFLNRIERGDPRGTFSQYVMRDLIGAANGEAAMRRIFAKRILELKDDVDLKEKIPDSPFIDPLSGDTIPMTRKNLRAVLQNVGNESNLDKLSRGYKLKPEEIMNWLYQHSKKEDWAWAQKQGKIFADLKAESDKMYRNLSGVAPEAIELGQVQTPWGVVDGWYHPIVYDALREGSSKKLMGRDPLEEQGYVRATTPQGYTQRRTGYAGPLSLDLDATPNRIGQMVHDITMRPSVINAAKIFYDKDIRAEISKRFGKEYRDLMIPYIQDVANSANFKSEAQKIGAKALEWFRQNAIASLIGFNPGTVAKHGLTALTNSVTEVGPLNFLDATRSLLSINEKTGESNWRFAMKESEELQRRMQHYQETVGGAHDVTLADKSLRQTIIELGSKPVAWSDLMSATPTWLAQFKKSMQEGLDKGEAVYMADRAVRRAHGSTAITSRPAIARGGALASWMSSLYGFFNHIMNRQYEMAWRANDAIKGIKTEGIGPGAAALPALTVMMLSYVIVPAIVEELVTPLPEGKHEGWAAKAAKALTFSVTGSWIGIRDFAHAALAGRDPAAGLMSTSMKSISDVTRDLSRGKEAFGREHAGNLIQHSTQMFGMLTGLTNATEGRVGKFLYDVSAGKELPKTPGQWWYGLRHGKGEKK